jgi:hypothetical protein
MCRSRKEEEKKIIKKILSLSLSVLCKKMVEGKRLMEKKHLDDKK